MAEHDEEPLHLKHDIAPIKLGRNTSGETSEEPPVEDVYSQDIEDKARELSYFKVDPPNTVIDGISSSEYNLIKGAVTGPVLILTAPFVCAADEFSKGETALEKTEGIFVGFGRGLVRGIVGGTALIATGTITGLNQLRKGFVETADAPGQGRGIKENFDHILNSSYTSLALNKESESFNAELQALIEEGKLPAKKTDFEGREVPYTYQFFLTDEPFSIVDGFGGFQYNVGKGFIAGATLAVSAPFKDAIEKFNEVDEKGEIGGVEGAVKGLGQGAARGFVGGFVLATAGVVYGLAQFGRGLASLQNIPSGVQGFYAAGDDFARLTKDPLHQLILQKGYGLEEFIAKEEARIQQEEEDRLNREAEKKKWYEEHPGETHPDDVSEEEKSGPPPVHQPPAHNPIHGTEESKAQ